METGERLIYSSPVPAITAVDGFPNNLIPIHQVRSHCCRVSGSHVSGCAMILSLEYEKEDHILFACLSVFLAVSELLPAMITGLPPVWRLQAMRSKILPSSHSPSGSQSATGNEGGSVRTTVGVRLPWSGFAIRRLMIPWSWGVEDK